MSATRAVTLGTEGVRSTAVKVLISVAQSLNWSVHRGAGVIFTSPDGKVKRSLPDNNSIRESVFRQSLRALVTYSDTTGTPYMAEDVIKTFKPDATIRKMLVQEFGAIQHPKEPKPIVSYRNDAPKPIASFRTDPIEMKAPTPTLTNDPKITELMEEKVSRAEEKLIARIVGPWPQVVPWIVGEGGPASYTSETLVKLVDEDGSSYAACILCMERMEPKMIGTHRRWKHPNAPRKRGYVRKTTQPYRKKAKPKEHFSGEMPLSNAAEILRSAVDVIDSIVADNERLREENGLLHSEIERLTADRKALRELLS